MTTLDKITAIIRNNIRIEAEIKEDTNMRKDLAIDSFDALMIMNEIDDAYAISIDEDDFKAVNTPREIVDLLKAKYGVGDVQG